MATDKPGVDYRQTLNLPKTAFPMRAQLPTKEPLLQQRWERLDIYSSLRRLRGGRELFILHDGPPYANGEIHIGTALNKVLKDIIVRFASLRGFDAPFVPGWDTHGLPIERRALAEIGIDRREIPAADLRRRCEAYARRFIGIMTSQFQRLGVLGDWENPYVTMNPAYEAEQILVFGEMFRRGYIYKGLKTVYWCPECETAMAEAEIEYHEKRSPSIYVTFPVRDGHGFLPQGTGVLIWTTTPWTLPANLAIALHPEAEYQLVETDRGPLLVAVERWADVSAACGLLGGRVLGRWRGAELEGIVCRHPLFDRDSLVVLGDHVTTEEGTGCVHTAPDHGQEDFEVGRRYNLSVLEPIDGRGVFTAAAGPFAGLFYADANEPIMAALTAAGALLAKSNIDHQYAHCWRCKQPVLFRATEQWFASVEGFRDQTLAAIETVQWIPPRSQARITSMVRDRADWCISRQRVWGVPIPAFYCLDCDQPLVEETLDSVVALFRREGSHAWFVKPAEAIIPAGTKCPHCGGTHFRKETDTMDVWFDSGSSHAAVLPHRAGLRWPADLYLEGTDQHRGWFQSSLLMSVATRGAAPYKGVITHGFVVDGEGRKMSKSVGNVIDPFDIIDKYGADVLRLWVASMDYRVDIKVSSEFIGRMADVYRKIRNTFRFMLGNLYDFDPARHMVAVPERSELDRWLLARTAQLVDKVTAEYERYQYHHVYQDIYNFCNTDLSSLYLDVVKDSLYSGAAAVPARRAVQSTLHEVVHVLLRLVAPILVHTADEAWEYVPHLPGWPRSVHLSDWPEPPAAWRDDELLARWTDLLALRDTVARAVEAARTAGTVKDFPLAAVTLTPSANGSADGSLDYTDFDLATLFRVAAVTIAAGPAPGPSDGVDPDGDPGAVAGAGAVHRYGDTDDGDTDDGDTDDGDDGEPTVAVTVAPTSWQRCERCWRYTREVGTNDEYPHLCARCQKVLAG